MTIECIAACAQQADWDEWLKHTDADLTQASVQSCVRVIEQSGLHSDFFGQVAASDVVVAGPNYREQLMAKGLNSRQRAILELLAAEGKIGRRGSARIFAPEAVTRLALEMRGRFPYFLGSEFASDTSQRDRLYPLPIEDLEALTLKDRSFDAAFTCDVLEHVIDLNACLRELARILRPGGVMISTHPFTWKAEHRRRAIVRNGAVEHLTTPEYHGNPVSEKGSLVFTVPGWQILEDCRQAGFTRAEMVMIASTEKAIFGALNTPFINVLRAYK
jgi:SAM-dependent methyltransferase